MRQGGFTRRATWVTTVLLFAIALFATSQAMAAPDGKKADQTTEKDQKNVIIFVVDDLGFQLGCYGDEAAKTPNVDRLAREGTVFTRAHCTTASCSASRSVILSGLHNHLNGQYGHQHSYHHFASFGNVRSLPKRFSENGYRTCSIGKYHVAPEEVYHFDEYRNKGAQGNRNAVQMALNAKQWIEEDPNRPFFLYFCTSDPHRGGGPGGFANFNNTPNYYPGVKQVLFDGDDIKLPAWLPDQPEVHQEMAEYYQAVNRLDQGMGVLIEALEAAGKLDDTIILFLSDNGPPFPGAKTNLYEPGMNMPLVVRVPGAKPGASCKSLVSWVDLMPTVLDYAGLLDKEKSKGAMHGRSFLADVGTPGQNEGEIYGSHTFHEITMYYPMRVIVTDRYKLLFNVAHQLPYPFASDLYASPTWQGVLKRNDPMYGNRAVNKYLQRDRFELYDLQNDPSELKNLANNPSYQEVLEELQDKLKKFQTSTKDPWVSKWKYE